VGRLSSIIFRDGDEVEIGSRNGKPMTRYFPELVEAARANLPERCVIDGEVVVVVGKRLEFEVLQQRIHPATSRVNRLARETPASFVAFDILASGDADYTTRPFAQRRQLLREALAGARPPIHLTPATTNRGLAQQWFAQFEGAGLDGVVAKPLDGTYEPNKRVMFKIKHERTADCVVAGYRVHTTSSQSIGSLLLGLGTDQGELMAVGVIGAFPAARRQELFAELQPLVTTFDNHPWAPGPRALRKAAASDTPPSSTAGDLIATRGRARTSSSRSPSSTTSPTSCLFATRPTTPETETDVGAAGCRVGTHPVGLAGR